MTLPSSACRELKEVVVIGGDPYCVHRWSWPYVTWATFGPVVRRCMKCGGIVPGPR